MEEIMKIQRTVVDLPNDPFHYAEVDEISLYDSCNLSQDTQETKRIEDEKKRLKSIQVLQIMGNRSLVNRSGTLSSMKGKTSVKVHSLGRKSVVTSQIVEVKLKLFKKKTKKQKSS